MPIAQAIPRWIQEQAGESSAGPAETYDPSRYLRSLLDETSFIDIRGLQVGSGKAHRFPFDDLFMSLTTTASAEGAS